MSLPPDGALWRPVTSLDDVDVIIVERGGEVRVEVVDKRSWLELLSLAPADASEVAAVLTDRAWRARWPTGHDPGS